MACCCVSALFDGLGACKHKSWRAPPSDCNQDVSMLQERAFDTVDANRALGLPDDCREYTSVANILADLGVKSIKLMV